MKKIVLIIGGLITIILTALWYFDVINEPTVALGSAILTFLSYLFSDKENPFSKIKIKQKHSGNGDNVAGNKIIKK